MYSIPELAAILGSFLVLAIAVAVIARTVVDELERIVAALRMDDQ